MNSDIYILIAEFCGPLTIRYLRLVCKDSSGVKLSNDIVAYIAELLTGSHPSFGMPDWKNIKNKGRVAKYNNFYLNNLYGKYYPHDLLPSIARYGTFEMFKKMRRLGYSFNDFVSCYNAARAGNIDIIKWLFKINSCRIKEIVSSNNNLKQAAAANNYTEVAKWLIRDTYIPEIYDKY